MRPRHLSIWLLFLCASAPAMAQDDRGQPALDKLYDEGSLQRELPGFPKPRPGSPDSASSAGGSLSLTLGGGAGDSAPGDGSWDGGDGARGDGGSGRRGADGAGGGAGGELELTLSGAGGGAGGDRAAQGDGAQGRGPDDARGEGAGQGGSFKIDGSMAGVGGQGGVESPEGAGASGASSQAGDGGVKGAGDGAPAPSGAKVAPKLPLVPQPPSPPIAPKRADPSASILRAVAYALGAVIFICLLLWAWRRRKERQDASLPASGAASQPALLADLEQRAGGGAPASLAAAGRFSEAIHGLLLEALRALLEARAELGAPSMTARAISARSGLEGAASEALGVLVSAAELCVFAGRMADEALYMRCLAASATFHEQLGRGGAT